MSVARLFVLGLISLLVPATAQAQDETVERIRSKLKDRHLKGQWIYDDVAAGLAEAKRTGKLALFVFR